jgi:hypothetical protein
MSFSLFATDDLVRLNSFIACAALGVEEAEQSF